MSISEIDLTNLGINYERISESFKRSIISLDSQVEQHHSNAFIGFPIFNKDIFNNFTENFHKENIEETNPETNEILNGIVKFNVNKLKLKSDNDFKNSNEDLIFDDFNNSNKDLAFNSNNFNLGNSNNINNSIIINVINKTLPNNKNIKENKKENKNENKNENKIIIINKKRRYFNVVYPNTFFIFQKGGNDKYIKKYIEESLKILPKESECLFPFKNKNIKIKKCARKHNADLIRKKIKAKFLKSLKQQVNKKLKLAGSIKEFNYLQQIFISNINKEINDGVLDLTFKELFSLNFCKYEIDGDPNLQKYKDNISVIQYLEERPEISKKSNYEIFKDLKYYQIFEEYLRSKQFENDICKLMKKNNYEYIKKYIKLAYELNDFFHY